MNNSINRYKLFSSIFSSKKECFFALSLLFCLPVTAQDVKAIATVSENIIAIDDPFQLSITVNDSILRTDIDFSALEADFIYGTPSVSSSTSVINGKVDKSTNWRIMLKARNEGTFIIPSIDIKGLSTNPIKIQVVPSSQAIQEANQDIEIKATINNDDPYIGESFIYDLELRVGTRLNSPSLAAPYGEGLEITQLGKDKESEKLINGRKYIVINRQYQIKPTKAGSTILAGAIFSGEQVKGYGFNTLTVPFQRQASNINLKIKAKPENISGIWLPTPDLQISQEWQPNITSKMQAKVGEAINRIITLKIKNISQSEMPNLNISYPDTVKVYEGKSNYSLDNDYSVIQLNQVIIPRQAGNIKLTDLNINWFNTETELPQTSTLDGIALTILPSENTHSSSALPSALPLQAINPVSTQVEKEAGLWPWITALFATLWLTTLGLYWRNNKKRSEDNRKRSEDNKKRSEDTDISFRQLKKAIKTKDIGRISWLYQRLDLASLPKAMEDEIAKEMDAMLVAHYSASPSAWDNNTLLTLIKTAEKHKLERQKTSPLAEL